VKALLTPAEAQGLLGFKSRPAFVRALKRDNVPHIKLNARTIRFDEDQLRSWIQSRTVGGRS